MNLYPINYNSGQKIKTDAQKITTDEAFISHFQVSALTAVAGSNTAILAATVLTTATQAITANITNPLAPRNIKIIGNAAGIVGNVTINGTNYNGDVINEIIALSGITAVEGAKAFKTVTEIDLPIKTNASGDTVSVGFGEKLGIPYKLSHNTVINTYLNNVKEGTAPAVTTSATALENNTIDLSSALNSTIVDVYLIV